MIIRPSNLPNNVAIDNNITNNKKDEKNLDSTQNIQSAANTIENDISDSKKLDVIKQKIDNDKYQIDVENTADKMAQKLLIGIVVF